MRGLEPKYTDRVRYENSKHYERKVAPKFYLPLNWKKDGHTDKENTMKLAVVLLFALSTVLLLAQAPQAYRTTHSTATDALSIHTKFFDAIQGNRLQASVSCNFVDHPCLAGEPFYWDGVHVSTYHRFTEIVGLRQLNSRKGTQQEFFVLTIRPLTTKQIQVIAPGEKLFANYTLLVQEDTSIDTK